MFQSQNNIGQVVGGHIVKLKLGECCEILQESFGEMIGRNSLAAAGRDGSGLPTGLAIPVPSDASSPVG